MFVTQERILHTGGLRFRSRPSRSSYKPHERTLAAAIDGSWLLLVLWVHQKRHLDDLVVDDISGEEDYEAAGMAGGVTYTIQYCAQSTALYEPDDLYVAEMLPLQGERDTPDQDGPAATQARRATKSDKH